MSSPATTVHSPCSVFNLENKTMMRMMMMMMETSSNSFVSLQQMGFAVYQWRHQLYHVTG